MGIMNETITEFEWKFENGVGPQVWLYVNPLNGKYAKVSNSNGPLAVFKDESVGRAYEKKSKILNNMIGHYVEFAEMLKIANEKYGGQYELISSVDD